MEIKSSEKLENLGKQYLEHLINSYDNDSILLNKEQKTVKKGLNIENNPCIEKGQEYYPELIPSFTILFATEMGKAEEFAGQLHKEATEKLNLKAKLINVSEVNSVQIFNENALIVIIASTWGEGEPTDDCVDFNKMVKGKEFWNSFNNYQNLNIAIFGLGNTDFTFYNAQAKFFEKVFVEEHNINKICETGLGNAKKDIDKDFENWKNVFFKKMYSFFSDNYTKNTEFYEKYNLLRSNSETKKKFELFTSDKKEIINLDIKDYEANIRNRLNCKKAKIINIEELRPNNNNGSTLKITLDLTGTNIVYKPAQNILVYPKNKIESIKIVLNQLAMDKETNYINYKINEKKEPLDLPLPEGITVWEALLNYCDLSCQINKNILSKLVIFLTDVEQKNKITEIINDNNKLDEFLSKRYNITDFIKEFDSLQLSLQDLAEIFPPIIPRYYTCASSYNKNNNIIELIITLVSWKGPNNDLRFGLTSNYFNEIFKSKSFSTKEEIVDFEIKDSNFKLPADLSTPMLMLCTGSGIAPFISFLQELESSKKEQKYETYLIFGTMNKKNDFIFEKELEMFKKNGILNEYFTAFSRDQEKKIYVQDVLQEQFPKEKINDLVKNKKMKIFICGSSSMGNAVNKKLREMLGDDHIEKMIKDNELVSEMWENK